MKKVYLLLVAFIAMLAVPASAQVQFGLKGGVNVTNMSLSSDVMDKENNAGFYVGPTVKVSLLDTGLGIDASVLYDQRKGKFVSEVDVNDGSGTTVTERDDVTQKQIAIPINLRYAWGIGSAANIFVFAGPQFGFNVGKDIDWMGWEWKNSNFSVNVGLGCTLLGHLQVNANYNIACGRTGEIKGVHDLVSGMEIGNSHARFNAWQIGLAYYF